MKKLISLYVAAACVLFLVMIVINPGTAISSGKGMGNGTQIPEKVMGIAEKSCVNCHAEPGNPMVLAHLDLTNWEKYSLEKQAARAKEMCSMVSKDKMPPNSFRKNHPDGVPSEEEIKTICGWAESLQPPAKK